MYYRTVAALRVASKFFSAADRYECGGKKKKKTKTNTIYSQCRTRVVGRYRFALARDWKPARVTRRSDARIRSYAEYSFRVGLPFFVLLKPRRRNIRYWLRRTNFTTENGRSCTAHTFDFLRINNENNFL